MSDAARDHPHRSADGEIRWTVDAVRVARNEVRFRQVNEAIDAGRPAQGTRHGFVCECGRLGCTTVIAVPEDEYQAIRRDFRRFVVAPGHQHPVDEVVADRGEYVIVLKNGVGADVARQDQSRMQEDAG